MKKKKFDPKLFVLRLFLFFMCVICILLSFKNSILYIIALIIICLLPILYLIYAKLGDDIPDSEKWDLVEKYLLEKEKEKEEKN